MARFWRPMRIVRLTGPAAGSEVKITSIDETIVHPQVAPLTSRAVLGPTQASAATATPLGGGGPITVDDLDGLAKLTLEVAPGALGVYNLEILAGTDRTFFTAPDATTVIHPDAFVNGKLTIAAVPEPSAALLGALALMLGGGWTLARRWFGTRRT